MKFSIGIRLNLCIAYALKDFVYAFEIRLVRLNKTGDYPTSGSIVVQLIDAWRELRALKR